jgi:hypothetical protein
LVIVAIERCPQRLGNWGKPQGRVWICRYFISISDLEKDHCDNRQSASARGGAQAGLSCPEVGGSFSRLPFASADVDLGGQTRRLVGFGASYAH